MTQWLKFRFIQPGGFNLAIVLLPETRIARDKKWSTVSSTNSTLIDDEKKKPLSTKSYYLWVAWVGWIHLYAVCLFMEHEQLRSLRFHSACPKYACMGPGLLWWIARDCRRYQLKRMNLCHLAWVPSVTRDPYLTPGKTNDALWLLLRRSVFTQQTAIGTQYRSEALLGLHLGEGPREMTHPYLWNSSVKRSYSSNDGMELGGWRRGWCIGVAI